MLILLAAITAFPEDASGFLLGLLKPQVSEKSWASYLERSEPKEWPENLTRLLTSVTPAQQDGPEWTCKPFRHWAHEVSRYSFATGQEVFARSNSAPAQELDLAADEVRLPRSRA